MQDCLPLGGRRYYFLKSVKQEVVQISTLKMKSAFHAAILFLLDRRVAIILGKDFHKFRNGRTLRYRCIMCRTCGASASARRRCFLAAEAFQSPPERTYKAQPCIAPIIYYLPP